MSDQKRALMDVIIQEDSLETKRRYYVGKYGGSPSDAQVLRWSALMNAEGLTSDEARKQMLREGIP